MKTPKVFLSLQGFQRKGSILADQGEIADVEGDYLGADTFGAHSNEQIVNKTTGKTILLIHSFVPYSS